MSSGVAKSGSVGPGRHFLGGGTFLIQN